MHYLLAIGIDRNVYMWKNAMLATSRLEAKLFSPFSISPFPKYHSVLCILLFDFVHKVACLHYKISLYALNIKHPDDLEITS